jgi:HK97 family phage prohead protease
MTDQPQMLTRTFDASVAEVGDGRTIDACIVPYNAVALVADMPPMGDGRPYQELFLPGSFERQLRAPDRVKVWLNFEHEPGLRGIVGHGTALHDRDDGLHGTFRVHANADGDKALEMVNEGMLTRISIEFAALRTRTVEGVRQRMRAHLDRVSLCRAGAYVGAEVLAVREEIIVPDAAQIPAFDPGLAELLEAHGVAVPDQLK